MSNSRRIVIVGAVAAGPKAASRIMRLDPEADVTLLEKGVLLSYAGCGLPYYIAGVVATQEELMTTPAGAVRDSVFFLDVKHVHVHNETIATSIDCRKKVVYADRCATGANCEFPYDKLVLATGADPIRPPIPGADLKEVLTLHGVEDAEEIKAVLARQQATDVVIVGGGLIGVEVTEALVESGCRVTMVELLPEILPMLDEEMAGHVRRHMESKGVRVLTGAKVTELLPKAGDAGAVGEVKIEGREGSATIPVDMVILSVGVRPKVDLARACGLEIGPTGAIAVDEHQRTSDPDIYAVGDCAEQRHLIDGSPAWVPLGSTANKQGRVAATDIAGGGDTFPGVLGSGICKVFDYCVARTGFSEREARDRGYDVVTTLAPAPDRPHYMPGAKLLMLKAVADKASRRLLGVQAVGPGDGGRRVDIAVMAIMAGMTIDQLAKADLAYAPPFSPAVDNILVACDILRNKADGICAGMTPMAVKAALDAGEPMVLLDVRSPAEVAEVRIPGAVHIPLGKLRERVDELPGDKRIVCFCKISLRGYEAALIAKAAGRDAVFLDGGIVMWPYEKEIGAPA